MAIEIVCPVCLRWATLPDSDLDKNYKCGGCEQVFPVVEIVADEVDELSSDEAVSTINPRAQAILKQRANEEAWVEALKRLTGRPFRALKRIWQGWKAGKPEKSVSKPQPVQAQEQVHPPAPAVEKPAGISNCPICGAPWKRESKRCAQCNWDVIEGCHVAAQGPSQGVHGPLPTPEAHGTAAGNQPPPWQLHKMPTPKARAEVPPASGMNALLLLCAVGIFAGCLMRWVLFFAGYDLDAGKILMGLSALLAMLCLGNLTTQSNKSTVLIEMVSACAFLVAAYATWRGYEALIELARSLAPEQVANHSVPAVLFRLLFNVAPGLGLSTVSSSVALVLSVVNHRNAVASIQESEDRPPAAKGWDIAWQLLMAGLVAGGLIWFGANDGMNWARGDQDAGAGTVPMVPDRDDERGLHRQSNVCIFCDGSGKRDCMYCVNGISDCALCASGCEHCNFKGKKTCTFCNGRGIKVCSQCNGTGQRH